MADKKHDRLACEQRYREYRALATIAVLPSLTNSFAPLSVNLSDINTEALSQVDVWRSALTVSPLNPYKPGWRWECELARYRNRPRRIELAIWANGDLCGLMIGRVSDRHVIASIHLIESRPAPNPLAGNIVNITTLWLTAFAGIADCDEISVDNPLPQLIQHYESEGYRQIIRRKGKVVRMKTTLAV